MTLAIVDFPPSISDAICLVESSNSGKTMILALIGVGMDFMMW